MKTYKVSKPWGYEHWITGLNPKNGCVLKYISINKGTKTSLQVHLQKYESNYLVEGQARYTSSNTEYTNKDYPYEYYSDYIDCGVVIDVMPNKIHQLYASSDIKLIEASTNHLDDVIRLQDDSGRSDGKIMSEHLN